MRNDSTDRYLWNEIQRISPCDIFQRNVQVKMGQAHVNLIIPQLYQMVSEGKVNLADIVTHKIPLSEAKRGYENG